MPSQKAFESVSHGDSGGDLPACGRLTGGTACPTRSGSTTGSTLAEGMETG